MLYVLSSCSCFPTSFHVFLGLSLPVREQDFFTHLSSYASQNYNSEVISLAHLTWYLLCLIFYSRCLHTYCTCTLILHMQPSILDSFLSSFLMISVVTAHVSLGCDCRRHHAKAWKKSFLLPTFRFKVLEIRVLLIMCH